MIALRHLSRMRKSQTILLLLLALAFIGSALRAAEEPPTEWVDPDTGHRVVEVNKRETKE